MPDRRPVPDPRPVLDPLPDWLRSPALTRMWAVLSLRLERRGLRCEGRVLLRDLERDERHAVGGAVGAAVVSDAVRIDLAALDKRLRERAGAGLVEIVGRAVGRPLVDHALARTHRDEQRRAAFDAAHAWLERHPGLAAEPWVDTWLEALRRDGVLTRDADGPGTLVGALAAIDRVLLGTTTGLSRTDLAAVVLHDSHALDDGSRLAHVVLRALAARTATAMPSDAGGRRALWETHGVSADHVSTTCLTLGLSVRGTSSLARRLSVAAADGDPVHVTWWDLHRDQLDATVVGPVLVCENPRVLEAVAGRYGGRYPIVCVSGRPALVVLEVLRRLASGGAMLRYHGDFDWPGIAIANQVVTTVDATPWLMSAQDYLDAPGAVALAGVAVEPSWDPELGAAMSRRGLVVHEEAVLAQLLDRLPS